MATIIKTWDAAVELAVTGAFGGLVAVVAADQAYDYTGYGDQSRQTPLPDKSPRKRHG